MSFSNLTKSVIVKNYSLFLKNFEKDICEDVLKSLEFLHNPDLQERFYKIMTITFKKNFQKKAQIPRNTYNKVPMSNLFWSCD